MEIMYSRDELVTKRITDWLADGQSKYVCLSKLMTLAKESAGTVQRVLGHMESQKEVEIKGSYLEANFENYFEIRKLCP